MKVDFCSLQETRYSGWGCRIIKDNGSKGKLYWTGNDKDTNGMGLLIAEEWIEKVFEVHRFSDMILP